MNLKISIMIWLKKQGAHAGYYPGNSPLHLRVYFEKTRENLYAAVVNKVPKKNRRIINGNDE